MLTPPGTALQEERAVLYRKSAQVKISRGSSRRKLRDYAAYAKATGYRFDLYVRHDTVLSAPLQEALDAGVITLLRTLL